MVTATSHRILFLNTLAFTVCFAAWMINGVLVTFLVDNGVFSWGVVETGWLLGIPVLTGSVFRLPAGILTDKFGGRIVFTSLLVICAIPLFFLGHATNFLSYALLSFGFGLIGCSFAVGIAFTSVWYPKEWQGRALGLFGMGNAGAALTTLIAPMLLNSLTDNRNNLEQWRMLPKIYAAALIIIAIVFFLFTKNKKPDTPPRTASQMLKPLSSARVWRFGLYYFLVFGCFVAFSQWLVPYFVNVYTASLVMAGIFASVFSFPSGIIRALGGWISDKWGARNVMRRVFEWSVILSLLLSVPKMQLFSPGKGIQASYSGKVVYVSDSMITVGEKNYLLIQRNQDGKDRTGVFFPKKEVWQEAVVNAGDNVKKKQLLARGTTKISFEANMLVYAVLVTLIGIVWGIGKAGVYKFIPDYFSKDIGVVGGMVGVIGGLGGFVCPIIFGYLLNWTGLWTSSWMLMLLISLVCYFWMQRVVRGIVKKESPLVAEAMEYKNGKE
jgi:NNP family nitrate/nitrite transporter-like MFS transporter